MKAEIANLTAKVESGNMHENEPLFCLRAKDKFAASVVRIWAIIADLNGSPEEKVKEARQLADRMDDWGEKQIPGRPETLRTKKQME